MEEVPAHQSSTYMVKAAPAELGAGTDMVLKVGVSCPEKCNLQVGRVRIVDDEGAAVKETELSEFDGAPNETDEFLVKAPIAPGEYTWTAVFPAQENEGISHEESSAPFSFIVKPHSTSIAVWDVPSPIAFGDQFRIKVGVECSSKCNLADKEIRIYAHRGKKVATGALGGVPWLGTRALYWAEVELEAPGTEGYHAWRVKFPKPALDLPHEGASYRFAFTTARQPEHMVTVEVIAQDSQAPSKHAHVLLRPQDGYPYRDHTDDSGLAKLGVPKGEYKIYVSKDGYEDFQTTAAVASDLTIRAVLLPVRLGY